MSFSVRVNFIIIVGRSLKIFLKIRYDTKTYKALENRIEIKSRNDFCPLAKLVTIILSCEYSIKILQNLMDSLRLDVDIIKKILFMSSDDKIQTQNNSSPNDYYCRCKENCITKMCGCIKRKLKCYCRSLVKAFINQFP